MGLDMYLWKIKREEVAYWRKANAIHAWFDRELCPYDSIENCKDYPVTKEDLIKLRNLCKKIISETKTEKGLVKCGERCVNGEWKPVLEEGKIIKNPEIAEELLPSKDGFFFGSTDYDQFYLDDLKNTVKQIDCILENTDFDKEEIYYSAWW